MKTNRFLKTITGAWGGLIPRYRSPTPVKLDGGALSTNYSDLYPALSAQAALNLTTVWACANLRAETIGTLPLHLYKSDRTMATKNTLYSVLHDSPNQDQTAAEFWSMQTAHVDMLGNGYSLIHRRRDGSVISMEPFNPDIVVMTKNKDGEWEYSANGDPIADKNMLHLKGFSMERGIGYSRLQYGRDTMGAQLIAETAAALAFKQGMKVGGFFKWEAPSELTEDQNRQVQAKLNEFGMPENMGRWMMLLKGMTPIAGADYRIKPAEAELLASRGFGVEQACRLFGVPPILVGHTDKASSWASSSENINLFYLQYSLNPTLIRNEQQIRKKLLTASDKAEGLYAKFQTSGMLRTDTKNRWLAYGAGLDRGVYNPNEVRAWEEMPDRDGGDEYHVVANMSGDQGNADEKEQGNGNAKD
jgi:HK97 family phage portal protein